MVLLRVDIRRCYCAGSENVLSLSIFEISFPQGGAVLVSHFVVVSPMLTTLMAHPYIVLFLSIKIKKQIYTQSPQKTQGTRLSGAGTISGR
ncbi:unnamed protein product [Nesidiocoris tenuis]|uniref:Uncharacterized protein n=1 Tax=Nesidiocoris tenuis TaxID=355587 RepID=A0A6H5GVB0_9HEMI|nr:unnamed protein product [Nesidiocoris tenuis]